MLMAPIRRIWISNQRVTMEFQLGYKSTVDIRLSYENKKVFGRIDIKFLLKKINITKRIRILDFR